jgi:uncharacterized membrane protein YeaQ/YmgE (transglycosylase-associated protein family)
MPEFAFSPAVQHWIYVVLIWLGFGAVAGLLAGILFPLPRPMGNFWSIVAGMAGSTAGLFGLGRLFPNHALNPISPVGFLAAVIGTFVLLAVYRLGCVLFEKPQKDIKNIR